MDKRICIYEAGTTDFASNGLGTISPTKCRVHWQENGEYSVEIEHPIDELGKYERICVNERVAVVPVPEAPSKRLTGAVQSAEVEIYTIATRKSRLRLRGGPGTDHRCLGYYAKGKTVTLIAKTNGSWYEVTAPDGKHGWMSADYLKYSHTKTVRQMVSGILQELPMRPQPFDIYAIDPDVRRVTVCGRHVFWRLAENLVCGPLEIRNMTAQQALDAVFAAAENQEHGFSWYAEGDEKHSLEDSIEGRSVTDILLGDKGICETYGLKLLVDWFDIFLVQDIGENRGVQLRYAKNIKGLEGGFDLSNVVTRLIPVGRTKDGEPLYLSGQRYLLSENEKLYTRPRYGYLNVSSAKVGSEVDGEKLTASTARALMKRTAQAQLDAGCDLPECSVQVRMAQLRHDPAYQQFAGLERICPGDTLGLFMPNFALALHVRLSEYDFDALSQRYEELTLGNPAINASRTGITSRQLGGASVTSSKLAPGSVNASALQNDIIAARHIQANSINTSALQAESVTAEKVAAGAIDAITIDAVTAHINKVIAESTTTDELYAAIAKIITLRVKQINAENITTDELYAALADVILLRAQQITADNIETDELAAAYAEITTLLVENINAGNVQADKLGAALANFVTMYASTGEFDFATIQNLVAKALSLEQASAESVYIKNLAVTSANLLSATLGKLVLKGDDGRYYRVFVGSDGSISTEEIVPTDDEIQNGQTSGGQQIVETSMNVGSLNASNLQASSAVINQILTTALTAEKITAADALIASASIPALYTTSIKALGAGLDLSANEYIQLIVGEVDSKIAAKSNVFRGETAPDDANVNDLWIVPSTGYTYQLAAQDGTPALWQRVKDSELEDAAKAASDAAETAQIAAQAAQDKANQNAEDMAQTVTRFEGELSSLQSQIDGSITTWFEYGAPTYYNYPASQWTTADMRNAHLGDLYYDRYTGYCYRWQLSGSAYEWTRISDTDVTKALNDAAAAKDVADSKRRVFVSTPTPPYDIGDLWVQGANGDILRCQKPRAAGGYYYASDWVPASKYTDDTKANENAQIIAQHTAELQLMDSRITARVEQSISEVSGELETQISSSFSEVTQTVDELRVVMEQNRAADKSELRTYLRYADGTLELGRSGSRYVARTSDNGFVVLQDGAEMAAMVQNTVSAPVVEARRQFVLGEYAIRIGADGGILFV